MAFPVSVPNPGFETPDPNRPEMPLGYSTYASPGTTAEFIWDRTVAHSGRASLSIRNQGPGTALWQPAPVPCIPGLQYRIAVWARTQDTAGRVGVSVRFRDAHGWVSPPVMQPQTIAGTRDWTRLEYLVTAPALSTSFALFLSNTEGAGGQVWFDDLEVADDLDGAVLRELPGILEQVEAALALAARRPGALGLDVQALREWQERLTDLLARVRAVAGRDDLPAEEHARLAEEWTAARAFHGQVARQLSLAGLQTRWVQATGEDEPPLMVGWQDAETRVWLRDRPISLRMAPTERLLAVRGEVAATQIVVAALGKPLEDVRVSVGTLRGPAGTLPEGTVAVHPIGFVHLTRPAMVAEGYAHESMQPGWWPEILLENMAFAVAAGDSQPVWLSVTVPRDAAPGVYAAPVTITPANAPPVTRTLEIEVADVTLPETWHFRNIMSFHDAWCREFYGELWTPELRARFLDFLLDRRINLASMYGDTDFSFEEIERGVERGQNTILLYTLSPTAGLHEEPWLKPQIEARARAVLDEWVPKLRERGWLDRAWLYGFDERGPEWFEPMRHVFTRFKADYPVRTITTAYDRSYGLDTGLTGVVDAFIPLMPRYDAERAAQARARGTQVWWYVVSWNLEQHLIRSRLIPWMTFKVNADGFLIWCINRWRGEGAPEIPRDRWKTNTHPVTNDILNDWDPWLDGVTPNSSANYLYPGENGPLSSMRLECFRDGIEDYDLLMLARERLEELEAAGGHRDAVELLRAALTIDDAFVKNALECSYDVADLRAHRDRLVCALAATNAPH